MAWETLVAEMFVKKIIGMIQDYGGDQIRLLIGKKEENINITKQVHILAEEVTSSVLKSTPDHLSETQHATIRSAAIDFISCLEKTAISVQTLVDCKLDYKQLSPLIQKGFLDHHASSARRSAVATISDQFAQQLISSLAETHELQIAFMKQCLTYQEDVLTHLHKIDAYLRAGSPPHVEP